MYSGFLLREKKNETESGFAQRPTNPVKPNDTLATFERSDDDPWLCRISGTNHC